MIRWGFCVCMKEEGIDEIEVLGEDGARLKIDGLFIFRSVMGFGDCR